MIRVCSVMCVSCPFSNESLKGFLADYTVDDFIQYQSTDILFPCHKMLRVDKTSAIEADRQVRAGELKLCRGYAESLIKSCKVPRDTAFAKVLNGLKGNMSDDSMSIFEFVKYHKADNDESQRKLQ